MTNAKSSSVSNLSAFYKDSSNSENTDGENNDAFTIMRGVNLQGSTSAWRRTGYASIAQKSNDYDDIRALYSDIPVKSTLQIQGAAMTKGMIILYYDYDANKDTVVVANKTTDGDWHNGSTFTGIYKDGDYEVTMDSGTSYNRHASAKPEEVYYWSVDGGLNWKECDYSSGGANTKFADMKEHWYDGSSDKLDDYVETFYDSGHIQADLSAYVGEVVDVLFAAQPQGSDVYVPVARINNVAVYGNNGTFYTKLNSVSIGGTTLTPTYFDLNDKPLNRVTAGNGTPQWNLGYTATNGAEFLYTIFEPYNVDAFNTRYYNATTSSGKLVGISASKTATVTIDGYTVCQGGVSEYKYTLDGGKSWATISHTSANVTDTTAQTNAKRSDNSFAGEDFNNGNYDTNPLSISISGVNANEERTLLVVAETTNGINVPVFSVRLKFT